jgi:hypothetical protein
VPSQRAAVRIAARIPHIAPGRIRQSPMAQRIHLLIRRTATLTARVIWLRATLFIHLFSGIHTAGSNEVRQRRTHLNGSIPVLQQDGVRGAVQVTLWITSVHWSAEALTLRQICSGKLRQRERRRTKPSGIADDRREHVTTCAVCERGTYLPQDSSAR